MDPVEARQRFAASPVARLATVDPNGAPHLVPITFAVLDDEVHHGVDAKPKRSRRLRRLVNVEANPAVSLLVDRYAADWSRLWWVRADGIARITEDTEPSTAALAEKYPQYRANPPEGPFVVVTVTAWRAWSAKP